LKKDNLTLRFRLFAIAWLLGAIICFSSLAFRQGEIGWPPLLAGVIFLVMIPLTLKRKRLVYQLARFECLFQGFLTGVSIGLLGKLFLYEPFIWFLLVEMLLIGLVVMFAANNIIKHSLRLKPSFLNRNDLFYFSVWLPLFFVIGWTFLLLIPRMLDGFKGGDPPVQFVSTKTTQPGAKSNFVLRHFVWDSVPVPKKSCLKMIFQGKPLMDPSRGFHLYILPNDDVIIGLDRSVGHGILMSGKIAYEVFGMVGPYRNPYDWAMWVATDRTAFLSKFSRMIAHSAENCTGMIFFKMPGYRGVAEKLPWKGHNWLEVNLITRDWGNTISLRFSSESYSSEQLWEMAKPILEGMKPDITLARMKRGLRLMTEEKSASQKMKRHSFRKLLQEMDIPNVKSNEQWMREARVAFEAGRFEDCKWDLVQPILDNYEGGKPYVLFGRALMKQGYPDPAEFFYRKAEFWMKDDPELKALEAEAERERDKQDPTGERFKPNPEAEKILQNALKALGKTEVSE
jgi:hypothetical protein